MNDVARTEAERIAIQGAGKGLYHWGDDEPNDATGYIARVESTDAALGVLDALSAAGFTVARLEQVGWRNLVDGSLNAVKGVMWDYEDVYAVREPASAPDRRTQ